MVSYSLFGDVRADRARATHDTVLAHNSVTLHYREIASQSLPDYNDPTRSLFSSFQGSLQKRKHVVIALYACGTFYPSLDILSHPYPATHRQCVPFTAVLSPVLGDSA